jgi:hypothetical protein
VERLCLNKAPQEENNMAGFGMARSPLDDPNKIQQGNNVVQVGPAGKEGPITGLSKTVAGVAAPKLAEAVIGNAATTSAATGATTAATGLTGMLSSGGIAAGMAGMAPMLAAAGPLALAALPFLFNYGTKKVPGYKDGSRDVNKYGDDPFALSAASMLADTSFVESQPAESMLGGLFNYVPDAYQMSNYLTNLVNRGNPSSPGAAPMPPVPQPASDPSRINPVLSEGRVYEKDMPAPTMDAASGRLPPFASQYLAPTVNTDNMMDTGNYEQQLAAYRAAGFNNGTMGVKPMTNMAYAGGVDSVPSMLTPGEAVIPAAAAQNPNNQPIIDSMIQEGRGANAIAEGQAPMAAQAALPMSGPLSGPAQRAQVESLQAMSMKKKAFEAEEMRKQQAFEQKLALDKQKALMSMQT